MGTRRLMPALCAASVLLFSACGDSNSPSDGGSNPPPNGDVQVRNDFYDPAALEVTAGTTVTWVWNSGGADHSVTFDDGGKESSGIKGSGTFEVTFAAAGTFHYHCLVHGQAMSGTITVTAAAGGSSAPPADGGGTTGGGSTGGSTGGGGMGGGGYPGY